MKPLFLLYALCALGLSVASISAQGDAVSFECAYSDGKIILYLENNLKSAVVICDLPKSIRNAEIFREGRPLVLRVNMPSDPFETVGDWVHIRGISPEGERTAMTRVRKIYDLANLFQHAPKLKIGDKLRMKLEMRIKESSSGGKIILGPPKEVVIEALLVAKPRS